MPFHANGCRWMLHTGPLTTFYMSLILKQCLCCLSNYDSKGLSQVGVCLAPAGCDHLLSLLQCKCLICRTGSAGKQAPVQFEIIHEGNKECLGILQHGRDSMEVEVKKGRATRINLHDTHARRTCPISYLSVTSDMLS